MPELVHFEKRGSIAVITVDNPPVNALSPGVPEGIIAGLERGNADPEVKAMVLCGAGRAFISGADIRLMGQSRKPSPRAYDLLDRMDKPVVAAIHGYALGGGYEHALACHYRIATRSAKLGLPEVLIGVIPGGGGTQRLPRLIGVAKALELVVTGRHVPAPEAKALGMIDEVADDDRLLETALAFAGRVADVRPLPRVSARTAKLEDPGVFDAMRKRIQRSARNQRAPYACIEAVEAAAALPFPEGIRRERAIFEEIVNSAEAKALRHAFFAEREAARIPDLPKDVKPREVRTAAVIGAGTMGGGIAMSFADFGYDVRVLEVSREALDRGLARVRANYETSVKRGSLEAGEVDRRMARIHPVTSYDEIADADVVIEAVFERMDVKKEVFAKLDKVMKPGALLFSNTSALDIDEIARSTSRPEAVAGAHFFSPANVMKLLEIVKGAKSAPETVATASALARKIGKIGVVCGNCDGFLANRSRAPFNSEMVILLEEGCLPEQVDKVMVDFGYPMGPFAVGDLAGLDIGYEGRKRRAAANPNGYRKLPIADALVEMGRLGQKTQKGWYRYEPGDRTPRPDPEVAALIKRIAGEMGVPQKTFTDEEILHRLLFSSVNEACRIIDEGIAYRASDVDVMWLYGFGFPRYRGGLMFWADQVGGPKRVHDAISAWHRAYGERWAPAPLLARLAAEGKSFADARPAR